MKNHHDHDHSRTNRRGSEQPPLGYIEGPSGRWVRDPDPRVQDAIRRAFERYRAPGERE